MQGPYANVKSYEKWAYIAVSNSHSFSEATNLDKCLIDNCLPNPGQGRQGFHMSEGSIGSNPTLSS